MSQHEDHNSDPNKGALVKSAPERFAGLRGGAPQSAREVGRPTGRSSHRGRQKIDEGWREAGWRGEVRAARFTASVRSMSSDSTVDFSVASTLRDILKDAGQHCMESCQATEKRSELGAPLKPRTRQSLGSDSHAQV